MLQAAALAAEPLRNASPIMAGGEDGLSPMSFGLTYSNYPKGFAYISTEEAPDIFVLVKSGTADARGFWWCRYDCRTPDGHQVYRKPVRCKTPWDGGKDIPSVIKVFQDGADIWLLRLTTKRIETARWNGYDGFEAEEVLPLEGIDHRINSFDCIRRDLNTIEIVLLCNDGKSYRPETFKGDTQSYYDGAGIYRGELPAAGVFRFHVDNGWHQVSDVGQVSDDMRVIIGPGEIAAVDAGDGCYGGYVVTNLLGSMKFIPYMERIPKGGIHPFHIRDEKGNVLVHKAYSSRLISVADGPGNRSGLLIGGEAAMYRYSFLRLAADGSPVYSPAAAVLEKNAPLYGGSLTVPNVVDWDGDGVLDIVAGNSEGRLLFFKNNGTDAEPDFAMSEEICAGGKPILLRPGYHVVQGPFEASWGYLCPTVYDWNGDGLLDVMVSGSRKKYEIMLNEGTPTEPRLAAPVPIMVDNLELYGTWRVRPAITKVGGVNVMAIMDEDNALHLYRQVDDYAFGGDAGMVMMIEPVFRMIEELSSERKYDEIIYMSPDGDIMNQSMANELSCKENIIILCGHYKGIDHRIREHLVTREISCGDYVVSGGELPASLLVDSIVRLIPGAIGDEQSALSDSFQDGLLSPPIYTRPAEFNGWKVPDILLCGDPKRIKEWQDEQALERTRRLRPGLLDTEEKE